MLRLPFICVVAVDPVLAILPLFLLAVLLALPTAITNDPPPHLRLNPAGNSWGASLVLLSSGTLHRASRVRSPWTRCPGGARIWHIPYLIGAM